MIAAAIQLEIYAKRAPVASAQIMMNVPVSLMDLFASVGDVHPVQGIEIVQIIHLEISVFEADVAPVSVMRTASLTREEIFARMDTVFVVKMLTVALGLRVRSVWPAFTSASLSKIKRAVQKIEAPPPKRET